MRPRVEVGVDAELSLDRARVLAASYLRVDPATIDPWVPLAAYGLDSLGALELVARFEDASGQRLPEWLLTECPDLGSIVAEIAGRGDAAGRLRHQLLADAVLPPDIQPARALPPAPQPRTILLTGATGFLGAWLLQALLTDTSADVVCLVRACSDDGGAGRDDGTTRPRERVRRNLQRYGLSTAGFDNRVRIVPADLARPSLGLSDAKFIELAQDVDAIHHAGASVNWVQGYAGLRAANVTGTTELLRLAGAVKQKPFTFVSSLSVCCPVGGPRTIDEDTAMLPHAETLPLGYAQTKCVAEALVRQAGARGLPVTVIRPALLGGDAVTGAASTADVIASLIRGCIEMGAAPDLDWLFDAVPVNVAARAIVRAGAGPHACGRTLHLAHPHPRHWRECVLWMRLFGYDVRLEPYQRWLERLTREAACSDHALHALRPFFLRRMAGRTIPEHLERPAFSAAVTTGASRELEAGLGVAYPPLDAALLDRYFHAYIRAGHLPPPDGHGTAVRPLSGREALATTWHAPPFIDAVLHSGPGHESGRVSSVAILSSSAEHSIIGELTSWRSRGATGVFHCRIGTTGGASAEPLDVIVKVKPPDEDVLRVADAVAAVCDARVAEALAGVRDEIGVRHGAEREVALYAEPGSRVHRWMPRCLGAWADGSRRSWGIVLERLHDVEVIDAVDSLEPWTGDRIDAAVDGLAAMHAAWLGDEAELLARPWIGHVRTAANVERLVPFWRALACHAQARQGVWSAPGLAVRHRELLDTVGAWWPALEALPRTLIHHDFNPRNIALRREAGGLRLVAFDWELATVGAPQRDLVELLAFGLPSDVPREVLLALVERHRRALEGASGRPLDRQRWLRGCSSALADLLLSRLAFYALVDRVRPQRFLDRVVRTWSAIDQHLRGVLP